MPVDSRTLVQEVLSLSGKIPNLASWVAGWLAGWLGLG